MGKRGSGAAAFVSGREKMIAGACLPHWPQGVSGRVAVPHGEMDSPQGACAAAGKIND
ncbi:MAG: hypothetical protein Q4A11_03960 [Brachymonas sp.]|nr:hypothetical protein [Brachymonas sp.]